MEENRKSYRIRTVVGKDAPVSVNVDLRQTYDIVDVLSLEIDEKNFYKIPSAGYGVIVGRVIANGGFGIPNAKVSVFIPYESNAVDEEKNSLYLYTSPASKDSDGVRYNLLPRHLDNDCHQDVGTMYEKEYLLDNNDLIKVFDKYYKYTAVTNASGDYFIYGVPVGSQTVHVDIDLSDIGVLSQRPRDMIYKGYNVNQFENPNKFKKDTNLNSLAQIYSQDRVVTVYPFWGDTTVDTTNGTITRCDIDIDYKFEPTCIFLGSIISDTGSRAISQRCVPADEMGKMANLVTGEGKIEMIRKTFDGKVEQFSIKGNNLIDGDGVWCYQIPMNLDYVITDEFGKMVPTDDPNKGIPTRTRVRFRISMNETETDDSARKRARFLVPNNPKLNDDYPNFNQYHEADYEFGTFTKEESYRDLFLNKVYTVKSYIPRLQKAKSLRRNTFTGIKTVNHAGNNNPFPYNNLSVKLTFTYRFLCLLIHVFCLIVYFINTTIGETVSRILYDVATFLFQLASDYLPCGFGAEPVTRVGKKLLNIAESFIIKLTNVCDDGNFDNPIYIPVGGWLKNKLAAGPQWVDTTCDIQTYFPSLYSNYETDLSRLFNCVENQLAQDQECTSFNFTNDWINGALYAPMWYRKVKSKKKIFFGLFERELIDKWCDGERNVSKIINGLSLCQTCAQKRVVNGLTINPLEYSPVFVDENTFNISNINENNCNGYKCHKKAVSFITLDKGLIVKRETKYGENVYYYKSVEYDETNLYSQTNSNPNVFGDIKILFATDIVLLGSLNECDSEGIPQFFKKLEGTTYNMPSDLVLMDYYSDASKIKFEPRAGQDKLFKDAVTEMKTGYTPLADVAEEIDESNSVYDRDKVYTDTTGADWGNYGWDQVPVNYNKISKYIYSSNVDERPDVGGLFYGLTCWSAYTKPKSCINLSRICEYGVSLDQVKEYPVYNEKENDDFEYRNLPPDGFVSYDELYDLDGRAMFATMNGNNLNTKINSENGFPIYDFMYLYPENFDGSLKNWMNLSLGEMPFPLSNNYALENNSESYVRFRYGRNRDDIKIIQFYNSKESIGIFNGESNKNRFPKYENSFYFYFGLNSGNTAIDKFRTLFYSDCKNDNPAQSVVNIEFEGNSWCSEVTVQENTPFQSGDGWVKIDLTYVDTPYKLLIKNLSGDSEYGYDSDEWMEYEKLFISNDKIVNGVSCYEQYENNTICTECIDYPPEGYTWLTKNGQPFGLINGNYRIQITDNNLNVYFQDIIFTHPYLRATIDKSPFRYKNEDLPQIVNCTGGDEMYAIASFGGRQNETMETRNAIGGFIKITDISEENNYESNFLISVEPLFELEKSNKIIAGTTAQAIAYQNQYAPMRNRTSYKGSSVEIHNVSIIEDIVIAADETLMKPKNEDYPPYCPYTYDCPQYPETGSGDYIQTNGGKYDIRIGVPKGGEKYRVTITMQCKIGDKFYNTRNQISSIITVPEPIPFRMFINGIDYELIKKFDTGWVPGSEEYEYNPPTNLNEIKGWNEMGNIDNTHVHVLDLLDLNSPDKTYLYIKDAEQYLSNSELVTQTSPYNWTKEYTFNPETVITGIMYFDEIPSEKQSNVNFILVRDEVDNQYYYYVWEENDPQVEPQYVEYEREGQGKVTTISLEEYYDIGLDINDFQAKNYIINSLNSYTLQRQNIANLVLNAFYLRENGILSLSITNSTYEKPVKTLILYSPDEEEGTSPETIPFNGGDETMSEYVCGGITVGTLKGVLFDEHGNPLYEGGITNLKNLGLLTLTPIGYTNSNEYIYKHPYWVAIQNALNETLPSLSPYYIVSSWNNIADKLFGVHIIEKKLEFAYNAWAYMYKWPFYYNSELYGNAGVDMSSYQGKRFSTKGLFAGYILNGEPDSYGTDGDTHFEKQNINDDENKSFLITTLSTDSQNNVIETRIPVVRLIHSETKDNNVYSNYVVNQDAVTANIAEVGKQHILITSRIQPFNIPSYIKIVSQGNDYLLQCPEEISAPTIKYSNISTSSSSNYDIEVEFAEGYYYTYFFSGSGNNNRPNPVYSKLYNNDNQYLTFPSVDVGGVIPTTPSMAFQCDDFDFRENNNIYEQNLDWNSIKTLFVVKISKDKQQRVISKTYDITAIEYRLIRENTTSVKEAIFICINIGRQRNFNYLKYFNSQITFTKSNGTEYATYTLKGYNDTEAGVSTIHSETQSATYYWKYKLYEGFSGQVDSVSTNMNNCTLTLTDATGLTHPMVKMSGVYNHFIHLFDN